VQPFLARLAAFDQTTAQGIVAQIPPEWLPTEDHRFALIGYLLDRARILAGRLKSIYGL
jgi:hypothetical protein